MSEMTDASQNVVLGEKGLPVEAETDVIQPSPLQEAPPHARVMASSYQFMGPIPSPQVLAHYEAVIPGLADRLINRFEKQSDHRMTMESSVTKSDAQRANGGLIAGFIIAFVTITSSTYCIMHGHEWSGTILGSGTLASLVGTFVYGSNSRRQERIERQKVLMEPDEEDEKEEV